MRGGERGGPGSSQPACLSGDSGHMGRSFFLSEVLALGSVMASVQSPRLTEGVPVVGFQKAPYNALQHFC